MPTEKPRVTFTISQDKLDRVDSYRFDNKFKNQTQAILALIEKGLSDFEPKKQNAPLYSDEAMKLAKDYDGLDGHGQRVVRWLADEEKARCASAAAKAAQPEAAEEKVIRFSVPGYSLPMSAGTGQTAGEEYPENYTLVKKPPRGTSFIARVSGDSMEPTYYDGDLVFVHAVEEIPVGKIGAFHMDGQQWVKELGDGVLISHNHAYAPRPMTEDIRCQGLVLGVCDESYFE